MVKNKMIDYQKIYVCLDVGKLKGLLFPARLLRRSALWVIYSTSYGLLAAAFTVELYQQERPGAELSSLFLLV